MGKRILAAAAALVALLASGLGAAAGAQGETAACAAAMNSQGSRCFSPTFSTISYGTQSITSDSAIGSVAGVATYVYAGTRTDQDFDTLLACSQTCFQIEVMPSGVEFSPTRCLEASSSSDGATLSVQTCDASVNRQLFIVGAQNASGCFEWKLKGSSPALAVTAHPDTGALTLTTFTDVPNKYVCRTD